MNDFISVLVVTVVLSLIIGFFIWLAEREPSDRFDRIDQANKNIKRLTRLRQDVAEVERLTQSVSNQLASLEEMIQKQILGK